MANKLTGKLNLSRLPKDLIKTDERTGEKYIWVDVVERRQPSQYGATHSLQLWNKEKGTIYLADLKPQEFGNSTQTAPAPKQNTPSEDLPF